MASMLLVIVMHSQEILATCTMSKKVAGDLLVMFLVSRFISVSDDFFKGNYVISEMHYDVPGSVPGAPIGGYVQVRVEGLSSSNPPEILQST